MIISKKLLFITLFGLNISFNGFAESVKSHISNINPEHDAQPMIDLCYKEWHWLFINPKADSFSSNDRAQFCRDYVAYVSNKHQPTYLKVLHENDKLAGFITYKMNAPKKGNIELLAIDENFRGKGYGKILLEHSMKELINKGANSIDICARGTNLPALNLYQKIGFKKILDRKDVPDCAICLEYDPSTMQTSSA